MNIDGNTQITITTNLDSLNVALESMGKQQYDRVANIINEWKTQAVQQIQALTQPVPATPATQEAPEA